MINDTLFTHFNTWKHHIINKKDFESHFEKKNKLTCSSNVGNPWSVYDFDLDSRLVKVRYAYVSGIWASSIWIPTMHTSPLFIFAFFYFPKSFRSGQFCEKCVCLPGCVNGFCNKSLECICKPGWHGMLCDKRKFKQFWGNLNRQVYLVNRCKTVSP